MNKPTLYKKINAADALSRNTQSINATEASTISATINKFFELFAAKHT